MFIAGPSIEEIKNLKKELSKQFEMKDLKKVKQILRIRITRDKAKGILKLTQVKYVRKVLSRFNMDKAKPVSTPLESHFRLCKDQSPKVDKEIEHISKVPCALTIGSLCMLWFALGLTLHMQWELLIGT